MAGNSNSGRRPQPTQLRILRGNPGKRPINPAEPTPPPVGQAFDTPPAELEADAVAATEWRRLAPLLRHCRVITEAERSALIALCQEWSKYQQANKVISESGAILKTPKGMPMLNPALGIADKALAQLRPLWDMFGLSPSGRAKITALPEPGGPDRSKWDGLLSGVTDARHL